MPPTYITSRNYRLPEDATGMAGAVWYNLWSKKNWPFYGLEDGATLYWLDHFQKMIVWKTLVTQVLQFKYECKDEVIARIHDKYGIDVTADNYRKDAAEEGYCVAYKVENVLSIKIPRPAEHFKRLGWMRIEDDPNRFWFGLLEKEPAVELSHVAAVPARQPDPLLRAKVEEAAIRAVTKHYTDREYLVVSREPDNVGWDLTATLGTIDLRIEVKGLSGVQTVVDLTPNEYRAMNEHRSTYRVCIVSNAMVAPRLEIFSYSPECDKWTTEYGRVLEIEQLIGVRCTAVERE